MNSNHLPYRDQTQSKLPQWIVWSVVGICLLPLLLNQIGTDFGSPGKPLDTTESLLSPGTIVDHLHQTLSGSFTHTILEWSAFCTALFAVILALIHFNIRKDATTPIIGVALFFTGCMDAFHTLAVAQAENGEKALETLPQFLPDIFFLDRRMPVMKGEETLNEIHHRRFGKDKFKIVAHTASAFEQQLDIYKKIGFHGTLAKPFRTEDTYECLESLLQVEFEYEEENASPQDIPADFSKVCLPEKLYLNLKKSADDYRVTDFEESLKELKTLGEIESSLATSYQRYLKKYEMEKIVNSLESASHEPTQE